VTDILCIKEIMIVYNEKDEKPALVFMVEICLFFSLVI